MSTRENSVASGADTANRPRSIKRVRRTGLEMETIRAAIVDELARYQPMTVRQVFYRLVSTGVIPKSEAAYKNTIVRLLTEMRLDGTVPYGAIADESRRIRRPYTCSDLEDALLDTAEQYRRQLWHNQPVYVQVWLEKDALAGVLYTITEEWDVPLLVTKGYPSITFLHMAAMEIFRAAKPTFLYYFGDHDPSGEDIPRNVEARLRQFLRQSGSAFDVTFEKVAVTAEQIEAWDLPTRPTKSTDTRSRGFVGESVEVDALPPEQLHDLARECIEGHIDRDRLAVLQAAETSEREILERLAGRDVSQITEWLETLEP